MPLGSDGSIRVLLVEDRADRAQGHYAPRVRRMADGFRSLGHQVTVLTSQGLNAEASGVAEPPWAVARFGLVGRRFDRLVRRADRLPLRHRGRRRMRQVTVRLRSLVLVVETRRLARQLGDPDHVAVVVCGAGLSPIHAVLFAPTRARWVSYRHDRARRTTPRDRAWGRATDLLVDQVMAARQRTRIRRRGRYVLAGTFPELVDTWKARLPRVTTGMVPLAVAPPGEVIDRGVARDRLGLPSTEPLALFFGTLHPGKSPDTVWSAWCGGEPPPVGLVAAGDGVRASLDAWVNRHPQADAASVHVFDGAIADDVKELLYSAVDIGILSFADKPAGASATMGDFITHDRPVCCSSGGHPAELVDDYDLGAVYEVEDPVALAKAVSAVLDHPPGRCGLDRFRADFSEPGIARDLVGLLFPSAP